jgi:hypothetical protein
MHGASTAIELGGAVEVLPLRSIGTKVLTFLNSTESP